MNWQIIFLLLAITTCPLAAESTHRVAGTANEMVKSLPDAGKSECTICKFLYGSLVQLVKFENASVAELEKLANGICHMSILNASAPEPVKEVCDYVLKDITKIRIAIVDGISAYQFCKEAKFCNSKGAKDANTVNDDDSSSPKFTASDNTLRGIANEMVKSHLRV